MPKGKPTRWSFRVTLEGSALEALNVGTKLAREAGAQVTRLDVLNLEINSKLTNASNFHTGAVADYVARQANAQKVADEKELQKLRERIKEIESGKNSKKAKKAPKKAQKRKPRSGTIVTSS